MPVKVSSSPALLSVSVMIVGFHSWPGAPLHRAYLGVRHRHVFHINAECESEHDERELEFHDLMDEVRAIAQEFAPEGEFGPQSCESIARHIAEQLVISHGRRFSVQVSEDGEASAVVEAEPG